MKLLAIISLGVLLTILLPIESQSRIPLYLQECYTKEMQEAPQLPMNLQMFVDIIRKVEKYSVNLFDLRIFSASMLHRFKFDGIEFDRDLKFEEGVLPFAATGSQRTKNLVIEELVPGNWKQFPADVLTKYERCALHRALSNTIWEHKNAGNDTHCMERPTEKISDDLVPANMKSCPLEYGVILTPYGTVAPGALIAGIAAALEPQTVAVKLLLNPPEELGFENDDVDLMIPKSEMTHIRSMWLNSILASNTKLDNVWMATVAGDLAEMAVYQGPLLGNRTLLGATGFWNSTMRPQIFYLLGKDGTFDATRAELVGAIDGFIIAKNLKEWTSTFSSLRLSEILDMYYSSKGIVFDLSLKACERGKSFWYAASATVLEQQVYAASQVLAYRRSIVHMTDEVLQEMVHNAVTQFTNYVNNHLFPELHCVNQKYYPKVEVLVTWDGAWSHEYTLDFLAVLLEDLNISPYTSRIAFLHGSTGEFLTNVTDSFTTAYSLLLNKTHVSKLNLAKIIDTARAYYSKKWIQYHENHRIGDLGQVILVLAPRIHLTDAERNSALFSAKSLRSLHPDINIVYYTLPENTENIRKLLKAEDYLITSSRINDITSYLFEVPHSLRPGPCNPNVTLGVRDQVEGYVRPLEVNVYRLDPRWRVNTKKVVMKIVGFGYGALEVCMWSQRRNSVSKSPMSCKELAGNSETDLTDYDHCDDDDCPAIYYRIRGHSSTKKCTEIDCKTPEHIRYLLRIENLQCSNATRLTSSLFILLSSFCILLKYFN